MEQLDQTADIAIVGGGIAGLAHAYMALKRGYKVVLFERDEYAVGASIRNFGLIWPIGQEPGRGLNRAIESRKHWIELGREVGFSVNTNGSLQLAYHQDEWDVLNEFNEMYKSVEGFDFELVNPDQIKEISPIVNQKNLIGGLYSKTECTVNPREAIRKLPLWLEREFGLILRFGQTVTEIKTPVVKTSQGESWEVERVYICSGQDFETLYPNIFRQYPVTKCKLQMMKGISLDDNLELGPSLSAGLTLRHYQSFRKCPSLRKVDERYDKANQSLKDNGIHVLLTQNNHGELIIGDSHHYSLTIEPFENESVNQMILDYLETFAHLNNYKVTERWHGVYPKLEGEVDLVVEPEPNVTIVSCLGGAGMTLSFGLAEENMSQLPVKELPLSPA